ncbi:MAG: hypothetical protein COA97_06985 [Flavobacteriales bacterium]|nr:MAG: hypothetical protein COA97_06985 [Flavobacteriales bacterium]
MAIDKKRLFYRLKFYGFGFGLGCVLVWATLYRGRDDRPAWLPEGRVLQFLEEVDITINDKLKCELECNNIPINFMDSTFWANAEVDFDKSATKRKPCPEHYIKSKIKDGREIVVYIENCEYCKDCESEGVASLRSFENLSEEVEACGC